MIMKQVNNQRITSVQSLPPSFPPFLLPYFPLTLTTYTHLLPPSLTLSPTHIHTQHTTAHLLTHTHTHTYTLKHTHTLTLTHYHPLTHSPSSPTRAIGAVKQKMLKNRDVCRAYVRGTYIVKLQMIKKNKLIIRLKTV